MKCLTLANNSPMIDIQFNPHTMKQKYIDLLARIESAVQEIGTSGRLNEEENYDLISDLGVDLTVMAEIDKRQTTESYEQLMEEDMRADAEGEDLILNEDDYE